MPSHCSRDTREVLDISCSTFSNEADGYVFLFFFGTTSVLLTDWLASVGNDNQQCTLLLFITKLSHRSNQGLWHAVCQLVPFVIAPLSLPITCHFMLTFCLVAFCIHFSYKENTKRAKLIFPSVFVFLLLCCWCMWSFKKAFVEILDC